MSGPAADRPPAERAVSDASPPWRVLDADDGPRVSPGPASAPAGPGIDPGLVRTVGLLGLAGVLAIGAVVLAIGSGAGSQVSVETSGAPGGLAIGGSPPPTSPAQGLVVEVAGAVREPGLFRVPPGSRVGDLIQAAGGYGPRVDPRRVDLELNLAALVTDGQRIRVPTRDDPVGITPTVPGAGTPSGAPALLDLNTATLEQLDTLPGIGPVTAEKIVAAREEAPFAAVEELRSRGILGERTFEQVGPLVTVLP